MVDGLKLWLFHLLILRDKCFVFLSRLFFLCCFSLRLLSAALYSAPDTSVPPPLPNLMDGRGNGRGTHVCVAQLWGEIQHSFSSFLCSWLLLPLSLSLSLSLSQVSFFVLLWLFFLALGPVGRSFSFCVAQNFEVGGYAPIDISFRSVPSFHYCCHLFDS